MANNQPAFTLRDGRIKLTAWANTNDKGTFHSVNVVRSYKDEKEDWQETTQLSGADILKAANLLQRAYNKISDIEAEAK